MEEEKCCHHGGIFPTFAALLLIIGVLWLLSELKMITIDIPWWPVIVVVVAIGLIVNHFYKKKSK